MAQPKVKLGNAPKTFIKAVAIVLLSGEVANIDVTFKYRTRAQFAALVDEHAASAASDSTPIDGVGEPLAKVKTVAEWFQEADEASAEFVLKIAEGWDLDDPFNEKSLLQLEDENPGALGAIATMYRQSVAEARAKN